MQFIEAIEQFLRILDTPLELEEMRLKALAKALDDLASSYHSVTETPFKDAPDPPLQTSYDAMSAAATRAFPNFGFYAIVSPVLAPPMPEVLLGDAIDDIADIACNLEDVRWRWHNNSPADAAWQFKFDYESHWGRHLHDLRSYVHMRLYAR